MSDTERLNLIEHYGWDVLWCNDSWCITAKSFGAVNGKTLREAIDAALKAQFEWSVGR